MPARRRTVADWNGLERAAVARSKGGISLSLSLYFVFRRGGVWIASFLLVSFRVFLVGASISWIHGVQKVSEISLLHVVFWFGVLPVKLKHPSVRQEETGKVDARYAMRRKRLGGDREM